MYIGGGVRVSDVLEFKDKHNLSNIMFLPYQDRSEMKYSLSAADLHVVVIGEPFVGIVHPCKIYGILCVGTPFVLIGPEESHISDVIQEQGIGYLVKHGDSTELERTIHKVVDLSDREIADIRSKSHGLVQKKFSRKILCSKLIDICNSD
jgi:glycosyltransferase involved in cell wall biosynthesis